jgi:dihydrodipicolinate synthase/N-acetylneuraminate lyase
MSNQPNKDILKLLHEGAFIPAHPLALTQSLEVDERKQRNLTRYYIASGVGGVAVAVHTTQFEIRQPQFNLLEKVLRMAAEEIERHQLSKPFIKVAGIVGATEAAVEEARLAVQYRYHLGLVSMGGLQQYSEKELIRRVEKIAEVIPVFGILPAAGCRGKGP